MVPLGILPRVPLGEPTIPILPMVPLGANGITIGTNYHWKIYLFIFLYVLSSPNGTIGNFTNGTIGSKWYNWLTNYTIGTASGTIGIAIGTNGITNGTIGRTLNDIGIPLVDP